MELLQQAEEALRQIHACGVAINDLHPGNAMVVQEGNMAKIFFVDFSHAILSASPALYEEDVSMLRSLFKLQDKAAPFEAQRRADQVYMY